MLDDLKKLLKHMGQAIAAMLTHFGVVLVGITLIHTVEKYIHWLTGKENLLLFGGRVNLSYVIQGGDLAMLVGVMVIGIMTALQMLRRHE